MLRQSRSVPLAGSALAGVPSPSTSTAKEGEVTARLDADHFVKREPMESVNSIKRATSSFFMSVGSGSRTRMRWIVVLILASLFGVSQVFPARQYQSFIRVTDQDNENATPLETSAILSVASSSPPPPTSKVEPIPRRLIFVDTRTNTLETKQPERFYNNLQNTIRVFGEAWNQTADEMNVMFITDAPCREYIQEVEPRLLVPYLTEKFGAYKSDICRLAALYRFGGYYTDNDTDFFRAIVPEDHIDFVAPMAIPATYLFTQNLIIVRSGHPVIRSALDSMIEDWYYNPAVMEKFNMTENTFDPKIFYQKEYSDALKQHLYERLNLSRGDMYMGPLTLKFGYDRVSNITNAWILQEIYNGGKKNPLLYPELRRNEGGWGLCNFMVHDNATMTPFFYSRFMGKGPSCPADK